MRNRGFFDKILHAPLISSVDIPWPLVSRLCRLTVLRYHSIASLVSHWHVVIMRVQRFLFCLPLEVGVIAAVVFNIILIPIGIGMSYLMINKIIRVDDYMKKNADDDGKIYFILKEEQSGKDYIKWIADTHYAMAVVYIIITISSVGGVATLLRGILKRKHNLLSFWLGLMVVMGICELSLIHLHMTMDGTDNWLAVWPFLFALGIYLWTVVNSFRLEIVEKTRNRTLVRQETTALNRL